MDGNGTLYYSHKVGPDEHDRVMRNRASWLGADGPAFNDGESSHQYAVSRLGRWLDEITASKRDVYGEAGYPLPDASISNLTYRRLYDRDAIAARVVEVMPKATWQVEPDVFEDEKPETSTAFEQDLDQVGKWLRGEESYADPSDHGHPLWEECRKADILSGIGPCGIVLFGIDDGLNPAAPAYRVKLDGPLTKNEEAALTEGKTRTTVDVFNVEKTIVEETPPLTAGETAVLDAWRAQRDEWDDRVENVRGRMAASPVSNAFQYDPVASPAVQDQYWEPPPGSDPYPTGENDNSPKQTADKPAADGKAGPRRKLLFMRSFDASQFDVVRWESNPYSPRFNRPVMYRVSLTDYRDQGGVGQPRNTIFVHWTRVVHVADNGNQASSSTTLAPPRMKAVLNDVLGDQKVACGAPEMYWKAAMAGVFFFTNPAAGPDVSVDPAKVMESFRRYDNGMQKAIVGKGFQAQVLSRTVADPTPYHNLCVERICIKLGIPVRVFKGSERGELASSQDDAQFNDVIRERQNGYVTPHIIFPVLDKLIALGCVRPPKPGKGYKVKWPDLDSTTDKDKAAIMQQRTMAYSVYKNSDLASMIPENVFMTRFDSFTDDEADMFLDAAKAQTEEDQLSQQMYAGGDGGGQDDQQGQDQGQGGGGGQDQGAFGNQPAAAVKQAVKAGA
jgi:hypothetical protein